MKVFMEVVYDPSEDQHGEASKLDKFRKRLYGMGRWRKSGEGRLEITL
jgi:hypothetical protein